MNIVQHSLISERKFGGSFNDYVAVHRFLDSTKLYFHNIKHRAVLHNTYGVELAVELFGDALENSSGRLVSVRDVAIAHLKEDLSGKVPTLVEWFDAAMSSDSTTRSGRVLRINSCFSSSTGHGSAAAYRLPSSLRCQTLGSSSARNCLASRRQLS